MKNQNFLLLALVASVTTVLVVDSAHVFAEEDANHASMSSSSSSQSSTSSPPVSSSPSSQSSTSSPQKRFAFCKCTDITKKVPPDTDDGLSREITVASAVDHATAMEFAQNRCTGAERVATCSPIERPVGVFNEFWEWTCLIGRTSYTMPGEYTDAELATLCQKTTNGITTKNLNNQTLTNCQLVIPTPDPAPSSSSEPAPE